MTVKELIAVLQKQDSEQTVIFRTNTDDYEFSKTAFVENLEFDEVNDDGEDSQVEKPCVILCSQEPI